MSKICILKAHCMYEYGHTGYCSPLSRTSTHDTEDVDRLLVYSNNGDRCDVYKKVLGVSKPSREDMDALRSTLATVTIPLSLEEVLQAVYDSEINIKIESCWDGGYLVISGNWTPRYGVQRGEYVYVELASELAEAVQEVASQAYPSSLFARNLQRVS